MARLPVPDVLFRVLGRQLGGPSGPLGSLVARMLNKGNAVASGRLELHEATMASLPFADGALDGWITTNTVYFVEDLDVALREAARVLAPGGRGVVGIAEPEWMARQPFARHGFTVRPVAEVVQALEATGLEVEHRTLGHREPAFHLLVGTRPDVRS